MFRRLAEMFRPSPVLSDDERSTKAKQLDVYERQVDDLNDELRKIAVAAHDRLVTELDGAVVAFRRRR